MTCPNSCRWLEKISIWKSLESVTVIRYTGSETTYQAAIPAINRHMCHTSIKNSWRWEKGSSLNQKLLPLTLRTSKNQGLDVPVAIFMVYLNLKKKLEYSYSLLYTRYSIRLYTSKYWNDLVNWPYPFRLRRPPLHLIRGPTQRAAQLPAVSLGGRALQTSAGHRKANRGINLDGVWRITE